MQKVLEYIPIIIPQRKYIDMYNHPNAYNENNISIYIAEDGLITLLIRQVNYKKFHDEAYILGNNKSISLYSILKGYDFNNLEYQNIIYDYNKFKTYPTGWIGMDDIRFINSQDVLVTMSECNSNGRPCLFSAKLNDNVITLSHKLEPSIIEKNWIIMNDNQVIYSVSPFVIKSLLNDDRKEIPMNDYLKKTLLNYHGSTNCISFQNGLICIIHKYENKKIIHRWFWFDPNTYVVKISNTFTFFKYSFLEFNLSLIWYQDIIYTSLALNEDKIYILKIIPDNIVLNN